MAEKERLLAAVQRLATDEGFRQRLQTMPREVLMAEFGIKGETYRALRTLVPVLLVGGLAVLGGGPTPDDPIWGHWGKG